ncbi:helix-turn-helix transcriptional regulator [Olsenella sp. YH-ols2217]|uniref:Helix-turn-helix transcriptional regulator n=1 Tax=Kribbibacterium absianum TaxID=3044210 RepID=A0ABT6ZHP3_9ACTN|nr:MULTISPECIES: helix-turn-helix transcriptional regulator [unclassified Olsenella]MDJ1121077.1 helix-turn-helix transcriptional regulator [Olsenella sp. YH-ols2216]MDJ1128568.1 helix-turn-helix transcriptional regulator [Olsenella sp. YH-ols2217]
MSKRLSFRVQRTAQELGTSIATWRKLLGIQSGELAERAGVSRSTISRLEHGDPSVSLGTFLSVCDVLDSLEAVEQALDPMETTLGRVRAEQELPQRVRR